MLYDPSLILLLDPSLTDKEMISKRIHVDKVALDTMMDFLERGGKIF